MNWINSIATTEKEEKEFRKRERKKMTKYKFCPIIKKECIGEKCVAFKDISLFIELTASTPHYPYCLFIKTRLK